MKDKLLEFALHFTLMVLVVVLASCGTLLYGKPIKSDMCAPIAIKTAEMYEEAFPGQTAFIVRGPGRVWGHAQPFIMQVIKGRLERVPIAVDPFNSALIVDEWHTFRKWRFYTVAEYKQLTDNRVRTKPKGRAF